MFSKISVLVPTRHRTHRLRTMLESYRRTTGSDQSASELVFRVDDDDANTRQLLQEHGMRMVVGPRLGGYGSLPAFFNELALVAGGDVVMLGNDDMVFVTDGWATKVLAAANLYPDGLFNIGVQTHNAAHYPLSVVSRAAVERLGFIYDPRIFWGDIYLRDVMGRLGRQHMLPDVEIQHDWAGHAPDKTFIEGEAARRAPGNHMTHHERAVDDAVAKLTPMLDAKHGITFIVATSGRPTLHNTLRSIQLWPGDELIVVGENIQLGDPRVRYLPHAAGNDWGHTERNYAMAYATGRYIAHLDDDDVYAPNHRALMDAAVRANPERPVIFRMRYRNGQELWRHKTVEVGNVGTPMSLVPNDKDNHGEFGSFYGGDITYLETYAARAGYTSDDFVWCEDVTVLIRPHTST